MNVVKAVIQEAKTTVNEIYSFSFVFGFEKVSPARLVAFVKDPEKAKTARQLCSATCRAAECSPLHLAALQSSTVQCSAVQCSVVQCSAVGCSAVQCSAV